jgi:hypothetical protein
MVPHLMPCKWGTDDGTAWVALHTKQEEMKLSTRLGLIVGLAALGGLLLAVMGLSSLRSTMLEQRKESIRTVLTLAGQQVRYFQQLEQSGQLSRTEAQRRAMEALRSMRYEKSLYLWARTTGALGLVLPGDKGWGRWISASCWPMAVMTSTAIWMCWPRRTSALSS